MYLLIYLFLQAAEFKISKRRSGQLAKDLKEQLAKEVKEREAAESEASCQCLEGAALIE